VKHDTLKRDGGWKVELIIPLKYGSRIIDEIEIPPLKFDHVIRWPQMPSVLFLLETITGVPEAALRDLQGPDMDRVMMAFTAVVPLSIRQTVEAGQKPFATPVEQLAPDQAVIVNDRRDPVDPHFPAAPGPVKRFETVPPQPEEDTGHISAAPPAEIMRKIG
jgi:hypothetical protein